jgi:hypothetical protein
MLHRHNWAVINQFSTESQSDVMNDMKFKPEYMYPSLFIRKHVTDFRCEICGKLKRKVIKSAD